MPTVIIDLSTELAATQPNFRDLPSHQMNYYGLATERVLSAAQRVYTDVWLEMDYLHC